MDRGLKRRSRFLVRGIKTAKPGRTRRWALTTVTILASLILAGTVAAAGTFVWLSRGLPDPNNITQRVLPQTTRIYDRTGTVLLYEVHGDQKRTVVELDRISPYLKNATLAAEDRQFYEHGGFSLKGYLRAFLNNLRHGTLYGEGGSTITQQLVKLSILNTEKRYIRKLKELVLSVEMERRFEKDDILKLYLNEIPYGSVIYGIESASQSYFGKAALDLTLSEAAVLAAIPKASTYYSPYGSNRDQLMGRAHFIVNAMAELGMVTAEEADEALADDVLSRLKPRLDSIIAPHFVFRVRETLAERFGDQAESGGLRVITTLDADIQAQAETAIREGMDNVERWGGSNAALLSLNPKNGEVLAMVGSADYFDDSRNGKFNHIFGFLQPGSSIKPMVYAAAFMKGYTPDTVLYDVATTFAKSPTEYRPSNYGGKEHGPVTIRAALAGSLNIPAVKALYLVGLKSFAETAQELGYTTFNDPSRIGLSLVLGGGEVYPYEHIAAFSVFPQDGRYRPPKTILKVTDASGQVLLDEMAVAPAKEVMPAQVARQVTNILSDNAARAYIFGESSYLTLGSRPVAAKTGTTNRYKDAWTVGFTPSLLAGVWVGNSDGREMKDGADSSRVAAPIWNAFMRQALEGTPVEGFIPPEPVLTGKPVLDGEASTAMRVRIDRVSGKLATEHTPEEMVEVLEFSEPHSILHFIDRNDPLGQPPANPAADPQYAWWEEGVTDWANRMGLVVSAPPTERDDVHLPENAPSVAIRTPRSGSVWSSRQVDLLAEATAQRGVSRVEWLLDGELLAAFDRYPFGGTAFVPNRFSRGFRQLTAVAYDDVGNRTESAPVAVNLTAEPGPVGLEWLSPMPQARLYPYQFPYQVRVRLDDYRSLSLVRLVAIAASGREETVGSVRQPPLPNLSFTWAYPNSGSWRLRIEAVGEGGQAQTEEIAVWVE